MVNEIMSYIMLQLGCEYEMIICENLHDSDIKFYSINLAFI